MRKVLKKSFTNAYEDQILKQNHVDNHRRWKASTVDYIFYNATIYISVAQNLQKFYRHNKVLKEEKVTVHHFFQKVYIHIERLKNENEKVLLMWLISPNTLH